jgi:hypothetical protein
MTPQANRLLSLVFTAAVVPLLALYALLMRATVVFGALITVVLNFSRQLARQSKGEYTTP